MHTNYKIYVVFDDENLKNSDAHRNTELQKFCQAAGHKWDERVFYQTSMNRKPFKGKSVFIIDESDARQFRDLAEFH